MFIYRSLNRIGSLRHFSSSSLQVLRAGEVLREKRVFTGEDVLEYSKVSRDVNPLHFDPEVARSFGFEDRIVHGMLVASLFPRIIASHFPGAIYVSQSLQFKLPVYVGDEIIGEIQATNVREIKKRHLVNFSTKCLRNDQIVIDGDAMALLPSKDTEKFS